jgi:leucyl-tRNA synthetase
VPVDIAAVERKWQQRWAEAKLFEPSPDAARRKFMIIFAYPGMSGFLHVGHMRSYSYPDVIARYMRMRGCNVFFPAGFHASGLPAVGFAKRVARGEFKDYLDEHGVDGATAERLKDPRYVVEYFTSQYWKEWDRFGISLDRRSTCTTIDPGYNRFIQWQMRKLKEKDLFITKPHFAPFCPSCGPVAVDAAETDLLRGGRAETVEYTVIKFPLDGSGEKLLCATLRPETVYGVTNIWVSPTAAYVRARDRKTGELLVAARAAIDRLRYQGNDLADEGSIAGSDLLSRKASSPATKATFPIFAASFVEEDRGTGIVMSVPAHAPFDLAALDDMKRRGEAAGIEPVPLIEVPGYSEVPARDAIAKRGVKSQGDREALEDATQEIYKTEFHTGKLRAIYGDLAGLPASKGKEKVIERLNAGGHVLELREFSEEVVCRSGDRVEIRIVPEQWFIRYSDAALTEEAKKWARESMTIHPKQYHDEIPGVLDWFGDRACVRQGSWLGTEFPFKVGWIVEPISDSTLYPAYYIVSRYLNEGKLRPEHLVDGFFDHVFAVRNDEGGAIAGGAPADVVRSARADFLHWYPPDLNCGGKEHKTVHFPPFIMNHLAILKKEHWPRGIFVNWWVQGAAGEKISKSKGGAGSIVAAADRYGADAIRLYYCHVGSPAADIEWSSEAVANYRRKLEAMYQLLVAPPREIDAEITGAQERLNLSERTAAYLEAMDARDLREAANIAFYEVHNDLRRYLDRGGSPVPPARFFREWIPLLAPFAPHLADETWESRSGKGFVSTSLIPEPAPADARILLEEEYHDLLAADVQAILERVKSTPSSITLFLAEDWKRHAFAALLAGKQMGDVIKATLPVAKAGLTGAERDVPDFVKKMAEEVRGSGDSLRRLAALDEPAAAAALREDLEKRFSAAVHLKTGAETAAAAASGEKKARASRPLKPGILVA